MQSSSLRFGLLLALTLAAASLWIAAGCAGPGPVAGGSTISGRVVNATNPALSVVNAYVYVPVGRAADLSAGVKQRPTPIAEATTGPDGSYTLSNVPAGEQLLVVERSGYVTTEAPLDTAASGTITVQLTLVPVANAPAISTVEVRPASASVRPNSWWQFTCDVRDSGGVLLAITPTWTVKGGIGRVDETGLFTAGGEEGVGQVVATVGSFVRRADVTVARTAPIPPPRNLTATDSGYSVDLAWDPPEGIQSIAGYTVHRAVAAGGPYTRLNAGVIVATTYSDTTFQAKVPQFWVVRTVMGDASESANSNEATLTPEGAGSGDVIIRGQSVGLLLAAPTGGPG